MRMAKRLASILRRGIDVGKFLQFFLRQDGKIHLGTTVLVFFFPHAASYKSKYNSSSCLSGYH